MYLKVILIRSSFELCDRVIAEDQNIEFTIALIIADTY